MVPDSTPIEIHTRWNEFASQLHLLNNIKFERQVLKNDAQNLELHGFCDASEKAYGACLYLRSTAADNSMRVSLYCAKSRDTPLKSSYTIPRLELCAAELLANLYTKVKSTCNIKPHREIFWSDSTVVLHWIRTSPHLLASQFLKNNTWKHGPHWLVREEKHWPKTFSDFPTKILEQKSFTCLHAQQNDFSLLSNFSSFRRLLRITAICLRWRKKRKIDPASNNEQRPASVTLDEIQAAETKILLLVQKISFGLEMLQLKANKEIPKSSHLNNLSPFVDENGIIRVGGRLHNSNLHPDVKHPILLPKGYHITHILIRETHDENLHSGIQTTLHLLRQRYWPIDGRNQIRYLIRKCVRCTRANPPEVQYKMSTLPRERVNQSRPFTHTGLDYCGPFLIKEKKYRNTKKIKAWICIFVCLSVRAVHIEVVSDLTSEEFIAALSRFISRHPACRHLLSDNATTFTGANNELKEIYQFLKDRQTDEKITQEMMKREISWSFIPPLSPHCGGIWEAAVKSCKHHLRRVMGKETLSYNQLNTLRIKIEAILNSRPLTALSSNPNDLSALTPSHFLHGETSRDIPSPNLTEIAVNRLSQWQHIEQMKQHFWKRWHKEYLNELNIRRKWTGGEHSITTGSLVLLRDDNASPLHWRLARVIASFPGNDGITRKVKLLTAFGITEEM